jgi:hypothetical protein
MFAALLAWWSAWVCSGIPRWVWAMPLQVAYDGSARTWDVLPKS